jgi:DNA-binding transcriptional ArsR family regulator
MKHLIQSLMDCMVQRFQRKQTVTEVKSNVTPKPKQEQNMADTEAVFQSIGIKNYEVALLLEEVASTTRLQILCTLANGPASPEQLSTILGRPLRTINANLKVMADNNYLDFSKQEKTRFYQLNTAENEWLIGVITLLRTGA